MKLFLFKLEKKKLSTIGNKDFNHYTLLSLENNRYIDFVLDKKDWMKYPFDVDELSVVLEGKSWSPIAGMLKLEYSLVKILDLKDIRKKENRIYTLYFQNKISIMDLYYYIRGRNEYG